MTTARIKDIGLGLVACGWLVGALSLSSSGDGLATPSGETLPVACWVRATTGVECPTCGMSRSFVAFFHGDLGHAFRYHPVGPVIAVGTVTVLVVVVGLALSRRKPLWGRPGFVRALSIVAGAAVVSGLVRMMLGGIG